MEKRQRLRHPASRLAIVLAALSASLSLRCGSDEAVVDDPPASAEGGTAGQSGADQPGGAPVSSACEPGDTRECVGPAACRGGQACKSDGSGWGGCDCGDGPIGEAGAASGGAGTVGGAGGGGGTGGGTATCSPAPQTGCAASEKCSIQVNAQAETLDFACVPDGDKAEGAACDLRPDGTDDCEKGLFCNGVGSVPRCQPYCDVTDAATCATACSGLDVTPHPGVTVPSGYGVCQPSCDLLEQDCGDGDACVFTASEFPVCGAPGDFPDGEDCAFYNQCEVGSACVLDNADGTASMCTPLCEATQVGSCEVEGETCLAFPMVYASVPDHLLTTGLCYPCELLGIAQCALLAPGGCAEEADCEPLLDAMGFAYTCDVPSGQCVMVAP